MMTVALLDEQDIFVGMAELADETQITDRHLPTITHCDLPPGKYRWIPSDNQYGGAFESVAWRKSIEETKLKAEQERLERLAGPPRRRGRAT